MLTTKRDEYKTIQFEETELRLGLPGGRQDDVTKNNNGKRGFDETDIEAETSVDLKLNLSTPLAVANESKLKLETPDISTTTDQKLKEEIANDGGHNNGSHPAKPPAKAQVVGWPPVRSFRKNIVTVQKKTEEDESNQNSSNGSITSAAFVKVSMDGAPYLRKVDLKLYKSYKELSESIAKMFSSFTIGNCESQGTKDFINENKLFDLLNGSEYVATYEDKDEDWMLVGDVPWQMFVNSCKRLRIMKGSEAIRLAPRAVEKCKNRS